MPRPRETEQQKDLFDRLYAAGEMIVPADEYRRAGREAVLGGRVYVNDHIKADFGEDWNAFRQRAFAAGVILVNDDSHRGPDSWAVELAESFPNLFPEGMSETEALEQIVQMAEEGKSERMSLAEFLEELSGREGISESDILNAMERELDWALRTFAEKAELEMSLRTASNLQKAKDRLRRKELARRQRENRELREMQQKTLKQLQWLSKNRHRAPEELKPKWNDVLSDIDIIAVSAANEALWSERHQATAGDIVAIYEWSKKMTRTFFPARSWTGRSCACVEKRSKISPLTNCGICIRRR